MAEYEFWLTDDYGTRITLLKDYFFVSYSKSTVGLGTLQIGLPYEVYSSFMSDVFRPDYRIDVWRSPAKNHPMKRDRAYMIRKMKVYQRKDDGVKVIELFGRDGIDLLNRRQVVSQPSSVTLLDCAFVSDAADAAMCDLVSACALSGSAYGTECEILDSGRYFPTDFSVEAPSGQAISVNYRTNGKNLLDALKEIREMTFQLNRENPSNRKAYFDVVEYQIGNRFGYRFVTYVDIRGVDKTESLEFSAENGNLESPYYEENYLEEQNFCYVFGQGRGSSREIVQVSDDERIGVSRWNRIETIVSATSEANTSALDYYGYRELDKKRPEKTLYCTFLNIAPSENTPSSLYQVDWDLGDRVSVSFIGKRFETEIVVVYVSVDENGKENITGRNNIGD